MSNAALLPSPLVGEGGRRRRTGEGASEGDAPKRTGAEASPCQSSPREGDRRRDQALASASFAPPCKYEVSSPSSNRAVDRGFCLLRTAFDCRGRWQPARGKRK